MSRAALPARDRHLLPHYRSLVRKWRAATEPGGGSEASAVEIQVSPVGPDLQFQSKSRSRLRPRRSKACSDTLVGHLRPRPEVFLRSQ